MFTGIIEDLAKVVKTQKEGNNLNIFCKSNITSHLKIDQSVSHNGVCLTISLIKDDVYMVTAINETLEKTNLSFIKSGDKINLERSVKLNDRLDGHLVQGHVDQTAICASISEHKGSYIFTFTSEKFKHIIIEKGSICINGVSLTCFNVSKNKFSVAVIPYTYQHTTFQEIKLDSVVNIEFDIIGKYLEKLHANY
tara:strand:+ start:1099 stop:1683 length:585 start_codon:yes stop_codon:yes gene_type:complete